MGLLASPSSRTNSLGWSGPTERATVNPIKLEIGLRPNSAGIPYTLLLRIEAMGFPTFLASTVLAYGVVLEIRALLRVLLIRPIILPLVSREWKNGSNSSYNCTPFLHSLLTKGKSFPTLDLRNARAPDSLQAPTLN